MEPKDNMKLYTLIYAIAFLIVLYVAGHQMRILHSEIVIREMEQSGIDYDAFRDIRISDKTLQKVNHKVMSLLSQYPKLQGYPCIDLAGYLTFSMMAQDYDLMEHGPVDEFTFIRGIIRVASTESFLELYQYYKAIFNDLSLFPVPEIENSDASISYENTWFDLRQYGGNRRHEGTDLMDSENERGFFPIISMTDGIVENLGWLEQGGYRVGIRSPFGGYFYYAHLDSYAPELKQGDEVIAGQLLGFMGDSGYGPEGTTGQFDVHLHLGIYVETNTGELSVNPYYILKLMEDHRTVYR